MYDANTRCHRAPHWRGTWAEQWRKAYDIIHSRTPQLSACNILILVCFDHIIHLKG